MQSTFCDSEAPAWLFKLSCGQKVYMFAKAILDRRTSSPDLPEPPQVVNCDTVLGEVCVGMCVHMPGHVRMCVGSGCRHTCVHTYEHTHVSQCVYM